MLRWRRSSSVPEDRLTKKRSFILTSVALLAGATTKQCLQFTSSAAVGALFRITSTARGAAFPSAPPPSAKVRTAVLCPCAHASVSLPSCAERMADPVLDMVGAAHAVQTWAADTVMPTIEELIARGGEVAQDGERPRAAAPLACATHELVFRCYEAANQFVAANKTAGFTKNSMTAYLIADSLGVPFVQITTAAKPHEAAEAEGKRILKNLNGFRADLQRLSRTDGQVQKLEQQAAAAPVLAAQAERARASWLQRDAAARASPIRFAWQTSVTSEPRPTAGGSPLTPRTQPAATRGLFPPSPASGPPAHAAMRPRPWGVSAPATPITKPAVRASGKRVSCPGCAAYEAARLAGEASARELRAQLDSATGATEEARRAAAAADSSCVETVAAARRELERQMDEEMAETRLKVKCAEAKVAEHKEQKATLNTERLEERHAKDDALIRASSAERQVRFPGSFPTPPHPPHPCPTPPLPHPTHPPHPIAGGAAAARRRGACPRAASSKGAG